MTEIGLVSVGGGPLEPWTLGPCQSVAATPAAVAAALDKAQSNAMLCLDAAFPVPDPDLLHRLLDGPCDVWHAGLRLGLDGHPRALDHVQPQWMFSTPADPTLETTSRHVSLRALLVRRTVLEQLGGPDPNLETLSGAGIEAGIRWIRAGALLRHVPPLAPHQAQPDAPPSEQDGFRCVTRHHGRVWAGWALARSVTQRAVPARSLPALGEVIRATPAARPPHYRQPPRPAGDTTRTVSVILPTIDRYSYLEPLLHQLAGQSHPPHEVLVIDQTPVDRRRSYLEQVAPGLNVEVISQDEPGQSTARNAALAAASGDAMLFLDDDEDVGADLIRDHLARLMPGIDAVIGGVDDATAGPPPPGFRHRQASPVFPTGNALVRRTSLAHSGLFDPVFDHGPRADRDIGTRLHLSGAVMVYDPSVMVFHHHAPMGGLRTHGARAVTRASARRSLTARNLPSVTETYLGLRYYPDHHLREARAVRILSILSGSGRPARRAARFAVQAVMLPDTIRQIRQTEAAARELLRDRPQIPTIDAPSSEGTG